MILAEEGPTLSDSARPRQVVVYRQPDGQEPFTDWVEGLRDGMTRKRILARLTRLESGNFGDCKPVGDGVSELRMFFGSGYRVYFAESINDLVILLCGGDKSSQDTDIQQAKSYWKEYQEHG
jgi:putative addiction module killer protein